MSTVNKHIFIVSNGINIDNYSLSTQIDNYDHQYNDHIDDDTHDRYIHNHNHIFIYGSAPNRGLEYVLQQWKNIKESIPKAELHIYYGFTTTIITNLKKVMNENQFHSWYSYIQTMLKQDGIIYHGNVDHITLTNAYKNAGFLLYPTTFQETGCITVLRAMSCGCIPITSRLIPSVLYDLTLDYDLGPKYYPLNLSIIQQQNIIHNSSKNNNNYKNALQNWLENHWTPAVISAFYMDREILNKHRMKMKDFILSNYTWRHSAQTMSTYFV